MPTEDSSPTLKILIIGPAGAGKSSLLIRYCDDLYDAESTSATIGVDLKTKRLSVHGQPYKLHLMDTAGQERFRTLSTSYYRGAQGVILVFDICNRHSFLSMNSWFEEAKAFARPGAAMCLVGSKQDREDKRSVRTHEAQSLAESQDARYCEVSAKTRKNVRQPFVEVVEKIVKSPELLASRSRQSSGLVELGDSNAGSSWCYC